MKMLKHCRRSLFMIIMILSLGIDLSAQSYADSLAQADENILSSIAPYEENVRSAILNVSQYPQALVKIERIQARSSQAFQDMVSPYPKEDQEKLYEISRFPELVAKLTIHEKTNGDDVKSLFKDFPEDSKARMLYLYNTHYDELVKMNKLYKSSDNAFQKIIAGYPAPVQKDFQTVISMPDVVNLLIENLNLTLTLGEEYKADPTGIRMQLDNLNKQLADKNEQDLAAYKEEVERDPQLQSEMKKAATDFSATYDQVDNPIYVTNNYYDNYPFPYWFSYPYWYSTPLWYPRPMYYHTGFYYGTNGSMVVVGLPSSLYSRWFFGGRYKRYPRMYTHYNNYYSFHRNNVYRGFNTAVYNHTKTDVRGRSRSNDNVINNVDGRSNRIINSRTAGRNLRNSQLNIIPDHFNNQGMQRFNATTYHSMGWQNIKSRPGVSQPAQHSDRGRGHK